MKGFHIILVLLSTSAVVYADNKFFEEKIQKDSAHQFRDLDSGKRAIRSGDFIVDDFTADEDDDSPEYEEQSERESTCEEIGDVQSSTRNQNIQFEVILPQSIRFMEVTKVDVMIYNNINTTKPLEVEVNLSNNRDNSTFNLYNNKCSSSLDIESELTKVVTVPFGRARYVSFYIQAKNWDLRELIKLRFKASIRSENYECELTKAVKVEPIKIRMYSIHKNSYRLHPSDYPKDWKILSYREPASMSVEITKNRTTSTKTNFSVTLSNEDNFNKTVRVTDFNTNEPIEILLPKKTKTVATLTKGSGLCEIAVIIEDAILIQNYLPIFNLKITPLSSSKQESVVRVCAAFEASHIDTYYADFIEYVIYDVEMPSGYLFKEVVNRIHKPEIKLVKARRMKSNIQIYFDDFRVHRTYCVDVRATKIKEVQNSEDAVVGVYDYYNKQSMTVGYYNFLGSCGRS